MHCQLNELYEFSRWLFSITTHRLRQYGGKWDGVIGTVSVAVAISWFSSVTVNAATAISFTLDEPCKTSAGVYRTDGTLVRTLWNNARYNQAGTYTTSWDGKDDGGSSVAAGTYQVRVLQHNVEYIWDGVVGNTSSDRSGLGVHAGFEFIKDMAISGTNAFYCSGYNEAKYGQRMFYTTNPQRVQSSWNYVQYSSGNPAIQNIPGIANRFWWFMASDSNTVYCASQSCYNWTNNQNFGYQGCIVASKVSDQSEFIFSSGTGITNNAELFPSGIYVGTQPGLSGLAVQPGGNVLAASVAPDNAVYLFDKTSGAALTNIHVPSPQRLAFGTNNWLWVISGTNLLCYTNVNSTPAVARTVTGLAGPLAVAVCPINANLILVADGGYSQQIKAMDANGVFLWTNGLAGGYPANGIAVQADKFWFAQGTNPMTFVSFAADGTYWVGDGGNNRTLHFDTTNYLEQIMYQPACYSVSVDKSDPARVFSGFLEYAVDYTKPISTSWTLVNNWNVNLGTNHSGSGGFYSVETFTNGRTYALIDNDSYNQTCVSRAKELCELTSAGLRCTGLIPGTNALGVDNSFGSDGAALASATGSNLWWSSPLTGFDARNNPTWGPQTLIASAANTGNNPENNNTESFKTTAITSSNVVICFDDSIRTNYHLGGVAVGGTNFLWKASPAVGYFDGMGGYEISNGVNYAGADVQAIDNHIVFGYHGEFFRSQGQAGQHLHFYGDGLFIGQFGEASLGYPAGSIIPAFVGNGFGPAMVKTGGEYYCYENDESGHGAQRWHLLNAANVREMANSVTLNGSTTLTNAPAAFPTSVAALAGNQAAQIRWGAVAGSRSYSMYYATNNGGPYDRLAANITSPHYNASGLSNGLIYYFVVSAICGGQESGHSEQVAVTPFDSSKRASAAGHQVMNLSMNNVTYGNGCLYPRGVMVTEVDSNAPALGQPAFVNSVHIANALTLEDEAGYGFGRLMNESVGRRGYVLFDWNGTGTNASNLPSNFTVTNVTGWTHGNYFLRQFYLNGQEGIKTTQPNYGVGLAPNPTGSIYIGSSDTNYHMVTVVSGSSGADQRNFTISLTATNGDLAAYTADDSLLPRPNANPASSHIFQFVFKGNSTLIVAGTSGSVQGLFFDDLTQMQSPPHISPMSDIIVTPSGTP